MYIFLHLMGLELELGDPIKYLMPLKNTGGSPKSSLWFSVKANLPRIQTEIVNGCLNFGKSRCQVGSFTSEGNSFCFNVSGKE